MSIHPIPYQLLIAYSANELEALETAIIARHVVNCRECTTTVARFRELRAIANSGPDEEPSRMVMAKVVNLFTYPGANFPRSTPSQLLSAFFTLIQEWGVHFALAGFVGALAGLVLVTATLVMAASGAIPGDSLYPVKTTVEALESQMTSDDVSRTKLELALARTRVEEISALMARGMYSSIPDTAAAFQMHVAMAAKTLDAVAKQDVATAAILAPQAEQALARDTQVLADLHTQGLTDVKPSIEQAITVSEANIAFVHENITKPSVKRLLPGLPFTSTATPAQTDAPTSSDTPTPVLTAIALPSLTSTPTATLSPTSTTTNTPVPTDTQTSASTATRSPVPTETPTPTGTPTNVPTDTATWTLVPTDTPTNAPTDTATWTPGPSGAQIPMNTPTYVSTQAPTPTFTSTNTPTETPTDTPTSTPTYTPMPMNTFVPISSWDGSVLTWQAGCTVSAETNTIEGTVTNIGAGDMQGYVEWQLLYSASSNPKVGAGVASGRLALKSGASVVLGVTGQTAPGKYVFEVNQRPGTPSDALAYSESCMLRSATSTPTTAP